MTKEEAFKVTRTYDWGKSPKTLTRTRYFCMACGKNNVWDDNDDDQYVGSILHCLSCGSEWYAAHGVNLCEWFDELQSQYQEYLKNKETK